MALSVPSVAAGAAACTESDGVAIHLSGKSSVCYLVGHRMRPGSVFGICNNGELTCYEDDGIPDKPSKETDCVAPEPGNCGSATTTSTSDDEEDDDSDEARLLRH